MIRGLALATATFAVVAGFAPAAARAQDSGLEAFVDSIVAESLEDGRLAGTAIGVTSGGETLLMKGYG